jgi:integrase/recombinase XerD
MKQMPVRLSTKVSKISSLPKFTNAALMSEFYQYMKNNGASESHTNNTVKNNMAFAKFLGPNFSFYDVKRKEQIIAFLDTKIKPLEEDPDRKWIRTWNDYLNDIKYFFRWLYNNKKKTDGEYHENREMASSSSDWEMPSFARIKKKNTKRLSPYLETELWERDELINNQG